MFSASKPHVNNESMLLFPVGKHTYLEMHLDFCLAFIKIQN